MISTQNQIRSRIDDLKLSRNGYSRQLERLDLTPERSERLRLDVRLLDEEIATLEKIAQLGRAEQNRERIEAIVRERSDVVRGRLSGDPALSHLTEEERASTSGEARALLWALGEDTLSKQMRFVMEGRGEVDPTHVDRAVTAILMHGLESGANLEARASAAYELGKLHVVEAIPMLANTLRDDPLVAELALKALVRFSETELRAAGLPEETIARVLSAEC